VFGKEPAQERLVAEFAEDRSMMGFSEDIDDFRDGIDILEEKGIDLSDVDIDEAKRLVAELDE